MYYLQQQSAARQADSKRGEREGEVGFSPVMSRKVGKHQGDVTTRFRRDERQRDTLSALNVKTGETMLTVHRELCNVPEYH